MILQKTRSTSRPCWISSLSRTFTSEKADHTVTGTGRKVAKNTTRQNNFTRGVERNSTKTFTIDLSVTSSSERRWSSWVALKKSSLNWIDLQAKTTVILPHKKKLMSIVVIGGSVRMWWISTRCRQGVNLTSSEHYQLCIASRKRRTRRTMKIGRKVPPHGGNGKLPGGIPIVRLHHKRWTEHWSNVETCVFSGQLFIFGMNPSKNWMQNLSWIYGLQLTAVYCHRRVV